LKARPEETAVGQSSTFLARHVEFNWIFQIRTTTGDPARQLTERA
jgi:hypothetical protein